MFGNFLMTLSSTEFHDQAPSMLWKFGSDLRVSMNFKENLLTLLYPHLHRQEWKWVRSVILVPKSGKLCVGRQQLFIGVARW